MWVRARLLPPLALSVLAFSSCARHRAAEPVTSTPPAKEAPPPADGAEQQQPYSAAPGGTAGPPAPGTVGSTAEEAPAKDDDASLATLEEAVGALDDAQAKLAALTGVQADKGAPESLKKGSTPARKPKASEPSALAGGDARCAEACKAFASLKRAADAVCRLTSATDARCAKARTVVEENRKRVQVCRCEETEK